MKKNLLSLLLAGAMTLSLAACAPKAPAESAPPSAPPTEAASAAPSAGAETVSFTDSAGRTVEVPANIERIVPSGPLAQIVLFALCPDKFVGVSSEWDTSAAAFLDQKYLDLPMVGQLYGGKGEMNLETILAADPQVVIDVGEPKKTVVEDLDALQEQVGIPFVHITATTETMGDAYRQLGKLLGMEDEAEALASYCDATYGDTVSLMEKVGDANKAKVVYCTGDNGLSVIAKDSFHAEVIDLMSDNLAVVEEPSSKGSGNETDMEQLMLWDPDVILFAPGSVYDTVGGDPTWQNLKAIQNGTYYEVPNGPYNWMGFPPSVQRYLGMLWMGKLLYPEQADYDLYAKVQEYFQLFYHCDITQEQFDNMTEKSIGKQK